MGYGLAGLLTMAAWMPVEWGFDWGWINWFNLIIVALLLAPNLLYALRRGGGRNLCRKRWMNVTEQIGRYGSMLFMVVSFRKGGFGFPSVFSFICYVIGSLLLLLSYWVVWLQYFRITGVGIFRGDDGPTAVFAAGREAVKRAEAMQWLLALLPCGIFLLSGMELGHIPLIVFGLCFALGHICVTRENIRKARG